MHAITINIPWSTESQDRVEAFATDHAYYIVLADGAGGMGGGAEAAELFVRRVKEIAKSSSRPDEALSCLSRLDLELEANPRCGEATGVVVAVTADEIRCASVGDSEAWLVCEAEVKELTEGQRRKPLLGSGQAIPSNAMRPRQAGRLLVSSDGLFRYASREKIVDVLQREPQGATLDSLVNLVRLRSGNLQDDVAIALLAL